MSEKLNVTHRKGDPCPPDMFIATPAEAFVGAHFQRDVEVIGERAPYLVRYDGTTEEQGAPIHVETVPEMRCTLDGRGLHVEDISHAARWSGIKLNEGDTGLTGSGHSYRLAD